jgi:hypothetical protein
LTAMSERIEEYKMLPSALVAPAALLLPLTESALGVAVLVPGSARAGAGCAAALFVVFSVAIGLNLARGRRFACGCGLGGREVIIGPGLLVRNAFLTGCAVSVAVTAARSGSSSTGGVEFFPVVLASVLIVGAVSLGPLLRSSLSALELDGGARRSRERAPRSASLDLTR